MRPALLALALALALPLGTTSCVSAEAAAPAFDGIFQELLPTGQIVGDGATPVTLHLLVLSRDGAAMNGLELKAEISGGQLGELEALGNGLYRARWVPPATTEDRAVELELKGKTAAKEKFGRIWQIAVVPPLSQQVITTINPDRIVMGQDSNATVSVVLTGGAAKYQTGAELVISPSLGTVANLVSMAPGAYTALYTPPKAAKDPAVAVMTFADRRDPTRTYGTLALPMLVKRDLQVKGLANSSVLVRIGDREFGPVKAAANGLAKVPVIIPPGVQQATIVSLSGNERVESPLDLKIPQSPRLRMVPLHTGLPADSRLSVPVRVFVVRGDGAPDTEASVTFATTAGQISAAQPEGKGVYSALWTPPSDPGPKKVAEISASVQDGKGPQLDRITVPLLPGRPAGFTLQPQPDQLKAGMTSFSLLARLTDAVDQGIPGRSLGFIVDGAKQVGPPKDLTKGDYKVDFTMGAEGPVDILATVKSPAGRNTVRQVLIFPQKERLPTDGLSSSMLTILALDEFGYPVANQDVQLQLISGEGKLPQTARTDASGMAQVHYTAGRKPGLIHIQATADGRSNGAAILQAPSTLAPSLTDLPNSGTQAALDLLSAWTPMVQRLRLER